MKAGNLFEEPARPFVPSDALGIRAVPANAVPTSVRAAAAVAPRVKGYRQKVLAFIRGQGAHGATCYEVEVALDARHRHGTISGRIYELAGGYDKFPWRFIRRTAKTRPTDTGQDAFVYVALPEPEPVTPAEPCPTCHGTGRKP